jgi:hypothetical protein
VLTVCDNAKESCPVFPGHSNRIHKAFQDPAAFQGTEEGRVALFRRVRDEIRDYLKIFPQLGVVKGLPERENRYIRTCSVMRTTCRNPIEKTFPSSLALVPRGSRGGGCWFLS